VNAGDAKGRDFVGAVTGSLDLLVRPA